MHSDTAADLRKAWREKGDLPCKHPNVELESVSHGYLTGRHLCTVCGAVLSLNDSKDSSTSE